MRSGLIPVLVLTIGASSAQANGVTVHFLSRPEARLALTGGIAQNYYAQPQRDCG